jgi:hypothetical protein
MLARREPCSGRLRGRNFVGRPQPRAERGAVLSGAPPRATIAFAFMPRDRMRAAWNELLTTK